MKASDRILQRSGVLLFVAVVLLGASFTAVADSPRSETNAPSAGKLTDDQLGEILQTAVLAARMGLYDEAEAACLQILEQRPNDSFVKQLLAGIRDKEREQNPAADLKHKLQEITIPEVNVRDAPAEDVINSLQAEAQKQSGGKTPINVVWQAPEDSKTAKVTLNLRGVPLADALKYVLEGVGLRYRVDPHAIVIYKPAPDTPKESSPANVKP